MQLNFETLNDLKNFMQTLNEEQLKQPLRFWGEEIGGEITRVEILEDDQINPSGECCENRSGYLPGGENYAADMPMEDEEIVIEKGQIMFTVDHARGSRKYFDKCPTCEAPANIGFRIPEQRCFPVKFYKYAGL